MRPGYVMANPPVLEDIESDPSLAGPKVIAEARSVVVLFAAVG